MAFWSRIFAAVALTGFLARAAGTQDMLWTAIIPQGFPHIVYTWHLKSDGRYSEDGHEALGGMAVQPTLSGHWRKAGKHMVLRQDGIAYVFDGDIAGDEYRGIVYLDGKRFSRFCAARGNTPPQSCTGMSA
jgi:hypothetical protein